MHGPTSSEITPTSASLLGALDLKLNAEVLSGLTPCGMLPRLALFEQRK